MEIGTEISQKIRSAIKAKLVELGAYVDDELPDYIMVMVANKKTKKHMSDDLSLFLGQNTDKFTSWLHNLLNKLQTLSTDQQKSNEIENDSKKASDSKKKSSQKTHSEAKVKNTEKTSSSTRKKSSSEKHDKESKQKIDEKIKMEKSPAKSNTSVKSSEIGKDTKKVKEEFVPELLVKEETDEFSEEFKEKEVISGKANNKPQKATSSVQPSSKAVTSSSTQRSSKSASSREERTVQKVSDKKNAPEKKKMPSSVVGSSQITKRYAEEDEEEYDPYNPAVGRVASVVKVDRRSTIPASLQANKLLVMKAVTEAEKSCAKSSKPMLQQEKMYSEKEKALIKPIQRLEPYTSFSGRVKKEEKGLELISKSRRQEVLRNMTYTIDNYTKKTLPERLGQKRQHEPEVARVPPVMDSRFVQCSNEEEEEEEPVQEEEDVANDSVSHTSEQESGGVQEVEETNSLSTEGKEVNEVEDDNVPQEEEEVHEEEQDAMNETDPEIQQVLEDVDDHDLDLDEQVIQPVRPEPKSNKSVKKPDLKRPRVPSPPKPINTKFIVTLDGVEPEIFENKEEILEVEEEIQEEYEEDYEEAIPVKQKYIKEEVIQLPITKITPPKITPISISLKDTDDEADEEEEELDEKEELDDEESPLKKAKLMERCKFWPACVNGNSCSYHHPTTSCKTFPHCKFGEKCLYIHPNCKFDSKCTRRDCPFTHASRRGNLTTVIQQIVPVPLQTPAFTPAQPWSTPNLLSSPFPKQGGQLNCKFYPNCRNMSCPFNHPKPCRYGLACMNKTSCTFYHPTVPTKDKLTWTAQKPPSQQHISERKFDAGDAKSIPTSVT